MRVSEHIHCLRIPFTIETDTAPVERFVNVFLIYGPQLYLIDAGVASARQLIFDYIEQTGRQPTEISAIMLTHSHPDHIGAAKDIKDLTGCGIMAHGMERDWIEDVDSQFRARPVPGFHSLAGGSVAVGRILADGDRVSLAGDLDVTVLHTPGHSRGSLSFLVEQDKALITGDAILLPGDMPVYDDPAAALQSLKKLRAISGLELLLSAWDQPRSHQSIGMVIDESIHYIQSLHHAVVEVMKADPSTDAADLCQQVISMLNLPAFMKNPLVMRSLASHLRYLGDNL